MVAVKLASVTLVAGLIFTSAPARADDAKKEAHREKRWERRFERIDTNHDGVVSKDEFIAFRELVHQRHAERREQRQKN